MGDAQVSDGMVAVGIVYVDERGAASWMNQQQKIAFVKKMFELMDAQRVAEKKCAKCRKLKGHT